MSLLLWIGILAIVLAVIDRILFQGRINKRIEQLESGGEQLDDLIDRRSRDMLTLKHDIDEIENEHRMLADAIMEGYDHIGVQFAQLGNWKGHTSQRINALKRKVEKWTSDKPE